MRTFLPPVRAYALVVGVFLLLQGTSTLAFRLVPALDQAFPALLGFTHMMPAHSLLHIATGILAMLALRQRRTFWFTAGFGAFYTGLGIIGPLTHGPSSLHLQPFDHPFHYVVGGIGLVLAAAQYHRDPHAPSTL